MKGLVACEFSGVIRRAFRDAGHNFYSCDLVKSLDNSPHHIIGDARKIAKWDWDIIIAHPPCTYLCNSGVRWLRYKRLGYDYKKRWQLMQEAIEFFNHFLDLDVPKLAVENPLMHGYATQLLRKGPTQKINPWQFGHQDMKTTCLWLKGLPLLTPTNIIPKEDRDDTVHKMRDQRMYRSVTFQGIANAMVNQWAN